MKRVEALVTAVAVLLLAALLRPVLALAEWLVALTVYLQGRPALLPRTLAIAGAGAVLVTVVFLAASHVGSTPPQTLEPSPTEPPPAAPVPRPPVSQRWLAAAGSYRVERLAVRRAPRPVDLTRPAAGVGHTTECSFECALRVFRHRYAPNFLVGRDRLGRVRIVQFVPLGEAARTMKNARGGVETNEWARAQIEIAASSHSYQWQPDEEVMRALASLALALRDAAGIPLTRPYSDTYSAALASWRRNDGRWGRTAGWFNHGEVPENDHWDMGGFRWRVALAAARREGELARSRAAAHRPPRAAEANRRS